MWRPMRVSGSASTAIPDRAAKFSKRSSKASFARRFVLIAVVPGSAVELEVLNSHFSLFTFQFAFCTSSHRSFHFVLSTSGRRQHERHVAACLNKTVQCEKCKMKSAKASL